MIGLAFQDSREAGAADALFAGNSDFDPVPQQCRRDRFAWLHCVGVSAARKLYIEGGVTRFDKFNWLELSGVSGASILGRKALDSWDFSKTDTERICSNV